MKNLNENTDKGESGSEADDFGTCTLSYSQLRQMIFNSFVDGYKEGAVAVATHEIQVERRDDGGYVLNGDTRSMEEDEDVSADTAGQRKKGYGAVFTHAGRLCELRSERHKD